MHLPTLEPFNFFWSSPHLFIHFHAFFCLSVFIVFDTCGGPYFLWPISSTNPTEVIDWSRDLQVMMKARRLRSMSSYQESLNDPAPTYEPSPKYEPPAEKFNPGQSPASSPTSPTDHQQIAVTKEDKLTWTKWTIPEGDQSKFACVFTNI
jgi:hypothetical protein